MRRAPLLCLGVSLALSARATAQTPTARPALDAVIAAFDHHQIVLLGEVHWNRQQHRFIQKLLHDPRLPARANVIAVEFGNSLYQPLLDRYIRGSNVPNDSLQLVWRNTTQPLAWDRSIYFEIFRTVRAVNKALPPARQLRVLALDPPIEWRAIDSAPQFPRIWGYRDPVWFATLDHEALSKGLKVLVIAGGLHILRRDPPAFTPKPFDRVGLGDAIAQRYPKSAYRIYPIVGKNALASLARASGWTPGTLADVSGTTLGAKNSHLLWPSSVTMFRNINGKPQPYMLEENDFPRIDALVDAVLYYGADSSSTTLGLTPYRDCSYIAELLRRNRVLMQVFGQDQEPLIRSLARAAGRSTKLLTAPSAYPRTSQDSRTATDCARAPSSASPASP